MASATDLPVRPLEVAIMRDVAGAGRGSLLVQTRVHYPAVRAARASGAVGSTTITLRGPGGRVALHDADVLPAPSRTTVIEHRSVVRPSVARALLGTGRAGVVRASVTSRIEGARAVDSAIALYPGCCSQRAPRPSPPIIPSPVTHWPPSQRAWGAPGLLALWVSSTQVQPFRPYVSTVAFTTPEGNQCVLQPDSFSGEGLPASGLVAGDGRFTLTSSRAGAFGNCWGGTVSGAVPAPMATGAVPSGVAVVAWSYQDILGDRVITGEQDVPPDF